MYSGHVSERVSPRALRESGDGSALLADWILKPTFGYFPPAHQNYKTQKSTKNNSNSNGHVLD